MSTKIKILNGFFDSLEKMESDEMMKLTETYLNDEELDLFVQHIEKFYGINEEEEVGMLAQLVITGYLAAKHEEKYNQTQH